MHRAVYYKVEYTWYCALDIFFYYFHYSFKKYLSCDVLAIQNFELIRVIKYRVIVLFEKVSLSKSYILLIEKTTMFGAIYISAICLTFLNMCEVKNCFVS